MVLCCSYSDPANQKVAKFMSDQLAQEYIPKYTSTQIASSVDSTEFQSVCTDTMNRVLLDSRADKKIANDRKTKLTQHQRTVRVISQHNELLMNY